MNALPKLAAFATLVLPAVAFGQQTEGSLTAAQSTFAGLDTDKDGKLSPQEILTLKVNATDVRGVDVDQDGFVSKDEFIPFYRQRLVAAGIKPAVDLEAEATRVLAARKAKQSNQAEGKDSLSQARRSALAGGQPRVSSVDAAPGALVEAFDQLQVKATVGKAAKADFDRVRELLAAKAREADRAAQGEDAQAGEKSEVHRKLLQSLDRLQSAAAAGKFSREEYQAVRESIVQRARHAAGGAPSEPPAANEPPLSPELQAIEKGLDQALEHLEQRAAAGGATREDFQRVRDQLVARARAAANASAPAEVELQGPVHRKLMQSLDRLEAAAQQGSFSREDYKAFRDSVIRRARRINEAGPAPAVDPAAGEAGLQRDFDQFEKHVEVGQVTPADFQALRNALAARVQVGAANEGGVPADPAVYRRLIQSLDRLEQAAQGGNVSREEFKAFKDSFVKRARNMSRDAQQSSSSSSSSSSDGQQRNAGGNDGNAAGGTSPTPLPGGEGRARRTEPKSDGADKGARGDGKGSGPDVQTPPAPQRPKPDGNPPPGPDKPKPSRPRPQGEGGGEKPAERPHGGRG